MGPNGQLIVDGNGPVDPNAFHSQYPLWVVSCVLRYVCVVNVCVCVCCFMCMLCVLIVCTCVCVCVVSVCVCVCCECVCCE